MVKSRQRLSSIRLSIIPQILEYLHHIPQIQQKQNRKIVSVFGGTMDKTLFHYHTFSLVTLRLLCAFSHRPRCFYSEPPARPAPVARRASHLRSLRQTARVLFLFSRLLWLSASGHSAASPISPPPPPVWPLCRMSRIKLPSYGFFSKSLIDHYLIIQITPLLLNQHRVSQSAITGIKRTHFDSLYRPCLKLHVFNFNSINPPIY